MTATDARDLGTLIANAEASDARSLTSATERHHHIGALITGARINRSLSRTAGTDRDPQRLITQGEAVTSELLTTADDAVPTRHRDIGTLIAHAGTRINHAMADRRKRWCVSASPPTNGIARYRPPDSVRRLVQHRDRRCVFPGCRRPVRYCDADHTTAYH
ncbi:hypothetical protein [Actinoallomurus iriomotensis]|uniref:DUF222 domain-containing protein n=1 Tax=Actinoallomurus iriomotensis TaxID=478107 RepID=A0A9W6S7G2_9ACTN|nr:hypothetical protein [Actinoallomurus iriomotensis]GLY88503.1 hypothetical protein Airi02_064320 [Actinoallomurus iriomotensis]